MTGADKTQGLAGRRLLLCVGGGIAAYKALELVREKYPQVRFQLNWLPFFLNPATPYISNPPKLVGSLFLRTQTLGKRPLTVLAN